jgi:hypothetical protein
MKNFLIVLFWVVVICIDCILCPERYQETEE